MYKILVIDENSQKLSWLKDKLVKKGIDVTLMEPVRDILATVKVKKPHLIVMEYLMGSQNGGELCCTLKKDLSTKHLPVIIFSKYDKVFKSLGDYGCNLFLHRKKLRSELYTAAEKLIGNTARIYTQDLKI